LRLLQSLDRRIGGWLTRRAGPRARELASGTGRGLPVPRAEVRRLLVIRPGGLGDAVLLWPMLNVLHAAFPEACIDVLCERRNAGAFSLGEPAVTVIRYDQAPWRVFRRLRRAAYELIIDTEQYHHLSTLIANSLRPRWLCGFDTLGRRRFQTHTVAHSEQTYEAVSFLHLAEAVTGRAAPFDPDQSFLSAGRAALDWADQALKPVQGRPIVAITPGAGNAYRLWPPERYAEVARWVIARGCNVVVLGGADDVAAATIVAAGATPERLANFAGRTTLAETAAILSRCRLSVSADTGVLHVAYGLGTPSVALFGPGLHRKWGPPGRAHRIVRRGLACSPCIRMGVLPPCPYGIACMQEMTVAEVIAAMEQLL
jgi:lipopolysaccharide heptosyltransferase II